MTRARRRANALVVVLAASVPLLLGLASARAAHATYQWREVSIAGRSRCLPVAFSAAAQEQGLMGVTHVARPMVFAYSPPATPAFWMKDTPAPLTGVWVGSRGQVIGYWQGRPETTDLHAAPAPVSAVIEYPAGARVPPRRARFAMGARCQPADRAL